MKSLIATNLGERGLYCVRLYRLMSSSEGRMQIFDSGFNDAAIFTSKDCDEKIKKYMYSCWPSKEKQYLTKSVWLGRGNTSSMSLLSLSL